MRFSLKWALAAMAYVALAVTALAQRNSLLANLLWAITILAFCVGILASLASRGPTRAMAVGFVLLASTQLICIWVAPYWALSGQLLDAAGFRLLDDGGLVRKHSGYFAGVEINSHESDPHLAPILRAANAVGAMAAGIVGCGLGALAYRCGRSARQE